MATEAFIKIIEQEFPPDRLTYQKDIPTFHPESAQEASSLFKLANRHKQSLFITGFGNNIDPIGKPFTDMISVRTDRLNDLLALEPEDFYLTAGAGFPLRELNEHLARQNLFAPHSALPYVGSVGGAIAVNLNARLNGHDIPIRRFLIKAEIVTPEGDIITPGSVCFKSVSGYDIVKIFAPSWGLLGLIVSACFRVFPAGARDEYEDMRMNEIARGPYLEAFNKGNAAYAAINSLYSRKIKQRFDPANILPVV